jgi:molybdopterin-containing oxidoreductase family iron-sulfur binding subunit
MIDLDEQSRRDFFRFAAASLALGGASGCAFQPAESIVPYVQAPETLVPGKPLFFASAVPVDGFACPVIVKSEMGRPIKLEGNPDHPASLGAADAFVQAQILTLYDPDRSQLVTHNGRVDTWENFQTVALDVRAALRARRGRGFCILTQTVTSPTLADQLRRLLEEFPEAKWHCYEAAPRSTIQAGCRLAFGAELEPLYHLDRADVVVALDSDFLAWGPGRLRDARAFASRREAGSMNRLYAVECTPSLTGAAADHRLPARAADVAHVAREIARQVGLSDPSADARRRIPDRLAGYGQWTSALARDLAAARGRGAVLAGQTQPAEVHAIVHLINYTLENVGKTVEFLPRMDAGPSDAIGSLNELAAAARAGAVEVLVILGGNPAYDAPADTPFADILAADTIKLRVHLGLYHDETAQLCHWHIPEAHCLESWSDLRACDGRATIQQPLIAPLYKGRSAHDLLSILLGQPDRSGLEVVRDYWQRQRLPGDFETAWHKALQDGFVPGTEALAVPVSPRLKDISALPLGDGGGDALELVFRPDPTVWDGRYANNGWLQELPKPLSRLTWGNAALISPDLARALDLENEDVAELSLRGRSLRMPVLILPGQAESCVTVSLGHGRRRAGHVGTGVGVDVSGLRSSGHPWFESGLQLKKTNERRRLAAVHQHFRLEGRDPIRVATAAQWRGDPALFQAREHEPGPGASLIDEPALRARHEAGQGNAWGMVINLNTCIGCAACVLACQAENNIPIVGREQVLASRELHWIRVDRYVEGAESDPRYDFQPVPCMHCEKAPCEVVCPVGATTHSAEGLNEMTYNRCVGTRYCSNNCPYKVRRFNFLQYADETTPSLKLLRNPDVTVRPRGVMEKCTYCVQRINAARIAAEMEDRPVGGDEVVTACQAACPVQAIVFGNLNDPASAVARARASPRNYALLAELNTRPRTTYLAKLRNPNPEIETNPRDESHSH